MGELVSLYRCKRCGIRMFEARTQDHLRSHGIEGNGSTLAHFERGPRDTSPTPGGQPQTYGRVPKGRGGRRKGQVLVTPTDDSETVEEEPVSSLDDLVSS